MAALSAIAFVLMFTSAAQAGDVAAPRGWRFPTDADYRGDWLEYRNEFPIPFHLRGDFNGDGIIDDAWILIRDVGKGCGLFVFLGRPGGRPRVIEVFADHESSAQSYALALVQPGTHTTLCGRGPECPPGEPKSVTLKHPGFEFITLGTASGLFYWSPTAKRFRSVTVAD